MVFCSLLGIGIGLFVLAGYLGIKYRHHGFDRNRFEQWRNNYLKKNPSAEAVEAKEWFEKNPKGAPTGDWLRGTYLKEQDNGKIAAGVFGTIGAVLSTISSVI